MGVNIKRFCCGLKNNHSTVRRFKYMPIDVIAVIIVFLVFSIGGAILIKKAEREINNKDDNHYTSNKNNAPLKHKGDR
jgi:uncharacterized membrane protein AbrB (regulator of aidB expression)